MLADCSAWPTQIAKAGLNRTQSLFSLFHAGLYPMSHVTFTVTFFDTALILTTLQMNPLIMKDVSRNYFYVPFQELHDCKKASYTGLMKALQLHERSLLGHTDKVILITADMDKAGSSRQTVDLIQKVTGFWNKINECCFRPLLRLHWVGDILG